MNILNRRSLMIFVLSNALTTQVLAVGLCPTDKANCYLLYGNTKACEYFVSDNNSGIVGTVVTKETIGRDSRYIQCQYPNNIGDNFLIYGTGCHTNFSCDLYCDFNKFLSHVRCQ